MQKITILFLILSLFLFLNCPTNNGDSSGNSGANGSNNAPTVLINETSVHLGSGVSFTFTTQTSDPDNDQLSFKWYIDDVLQNGQTASSLDVSLTPEQDSTYALKIIVSDGELVAEDTVNFVVYNNVAEGSESIDIGTVSGDSGSDTVEYDGIGDTVLEVLVTEDDSGLGGVNLRVTFSLQVPDNTEYDLYIYSDMGCTISVGSSIESDDADEQINYSWSDNMFSVDSMTFYIWVKCKKSNTSTNWSMQVAGNT